MKKLYCYVDETGQDTTGQLFIVAAVVVGDDREEIREFLHEIERTSGKDKKWAHARIARRADYITALFAAGPAGIQLYYAKFTDTTDYLNCTAETVARAVNEASGDEAYRATILVDGLNKTEQRRLGTVLRRRGVAVDKVRGLRDEADAFIRLADAVAGFTRDVGEGQPYALGLGSYALGRRLQEL